MTRLMPINTKGFFAALCVTCAATAALAESPPGLTTQSEVRSEISEAMLAVADYAEQERDAALARVQAALRELDVAIDQREQNLRDQWADLSDETRETARSQMSDLRKARNTLGERYGALQAGSADAWDELVDGFDSAWTAFADAWNQAGEEGETG